MLLGAQVDGDRGPCRQGKEKGGGCCHTVTAPNVKVASDGWVWIGTTPRERD